MKRKKIMVKTRANANCKNLTGDKWYELVGSRKSNKCTCGSAYLVKTDMLRKEFASSFFDEIKFEEVGYQGVG